VKPLFFSLELTPLVWLKDETKPLCVFQGKTQLQFARKSLRKQHDEMSVSEVLTGIYWHCFQVC